jgi:hypothetical protein
MRRVSGEPFAPWSTCPTVETPIAGGRENGGGSNYRWDQGSSALVVLVPLFVASSLLREEYLPHFQLWYES